MQNPPANSDEVGAVEVLQLRPEGKAGGVGQELPGGHGAEGVARDLVPEGPEWGVEVEDAVLPQGPGGGPDGEDLGEAGDIEDGVRPHLHIRLVRVQDTGGAPRPYPARVADGPHRARVDLVTDAFAQQVLDAVGVVRHGLPLRIGVPWAA